MPPAGWRGNDAPQAENLTQQAHAPFAPVFNEGKPSHTSPPLASHYVSSESTQHVFFSDTQTADLWEIWWSGSGPKTPENLAKLAGSPLVFAPDPIHSLVAADGSQHVIIAGPRTARSGAFVDLVARP